VALEPNPLSRVWISRLCAWSLVTRLTWWLPGCSALQP
jgi:hypothetical protein